MADLGRQVKYGIGRETVYGTGVPAASWINQLSFSLDPVVEYVDNVSAYGTVVKTNNSTPLRQHAEGEFEAKITSERAGYFLLGAFGTIVTTTNPDASNAVYNHTATIKEDIAGQSFTLVRKDSLTTKAYPGARFGEFTVTMELGDYIRYTANIISKVGAATTSTPAYTSETEFLPKHFTVKTASTAAGLGAATAIATIQSFTLTVNPNLEIDWESGNKDPYAISSHGYDLGFEMTLRYGGTTYEDAYLNGTKLALQVNAINTDVTIGTAAKPGLVFTAPSIHITDFSRSEDLDSPVEQSITGVIHYSPADAYALTAVLTNTKTNYTT